VTGVNKPKKGQITDLVVLEKSCIGLAAIHDDISLVRGPIRLCTGPSQRYVGGPQGALLYAHPHALARVLSRTVDVSQKQPRDQL
jgi:hypothetical protein